MFQTFLADYGMIWVGNESGDSADEDSDGGDDQLWRPGTNKYHKTCYTDISLDQ